MPKRSVAAVIFGGLLSLTDVLNWAFGWIRSLDWLQTNTPRLWGVLVSQSTFVLLGLAGLSCSVYGLREIWKFKHGAKGEPGLEPPISSQSISGDRNQQAGRDIVNNYVPVLIAKNLPTPELVMTSYGAWRNEDGAPIVNSCPVEGLYLHNNGETAYDIRIDKVIVGNWIAEFKRVEMLKKGDRGFSALESINRIVYQRGTRCNESLQSLDSAWRVALKEGVALDAVGVHFSCNDSRQNKFPYCCTIERDQTRRGDLPFRIGDSRPEY
jgi:hypothetical protein